MRADLQHLAFWQHLRARAELRVVAHIVAVITGGLALDIAFGWAGQIAAIIWTFALWASLYLIGQREERRVLILCTVISGAGEVILSLVWGIYDYQFHNVPLFVPPGHALLMTLGLLVARHLPLGAAWGITLLAAGWGVYAWGQRFDQFGAVLFCVFAFCMVVSVARTLYATMFVLALIMELYGTALGNWVWIGTVPGLNLSAANPPFSAGAFYCLLDLLVLAALRGWARLDGRMARNSS
jgi:hypothetical protein